MGYVYNKISSLCQQNFCFTKRKMISLYDSPGPLKNQSGVTAPEYVGIVSAMVALLVIAFPAFSGAIGALLTSVIESFQNFLSSV